MSTAISEMVSEMDGEADLFGAAQRRPHRRIAFFDVADDVLDHHDRVVHHKAGGNRQRHQGQVVEAVPQNVHHPECSDQRQRHSHAGNDGGGQIAQEHEDHQHHQSDGQAEFELNVFHGGADGVGAVGENLDVNGFRRVAVSVGSKTLMRSTT